MSYEAQHIKKVRNIAIAPNKQTTFGTAVTMASYTQRPRIEGTEFVKIPKQYYSDTDKAGKGHQFPTFKVPTRYGTSFDATWDLDAFVAGWLFFFAGMGSDTLTGTNPYTHLLKFLESTNIAPVTSLYCEETADIKTQIADMAISDLTISGKDMGPLSAQFKMVGSGNYLDGAVTLPAVVTPAYLLGSDILCDIQCNDGTQFFWSDYEGTYLSKLTGAQQFYNGWIKQGANFTISRDTSTAASDLVTQNISGNTIDRDVASAIKNHEFEGALVITRIWLPLFDASMIEFHCSLSQPEASEEEFTSRVLQLFDPAQFTLVGLVVSELCPWRYKSLQCGSTGTATSCPKGFTDCQDATRAAVERFAGVTITNSKNPFTPPIHTFGPGGIGDIIRRIRGGGGGGGRNPVLP